MTSKGYRSSASFGRRQEYVAIAELLKRGYDVYMTLVDDQGIDCVVRQGSNKYFDVQIKARSKNVNPKNAAQFPQLEITEPRKSYIFIFYSELIETFWVIPSDTIAGPGFSNIGKSGVAKGKYRLRLTNYSESSGNVTVRPKYSEYIDAFEHSFGLPQFLSPE